MASSSSSSGRKWFKYDVFMSFRGEDTRTNFVSHLYQALQNESILTYKDDVKIEKGKNISDELISSIEDSRFYIIIFSKNYASSSWCLDELVKIMECHRTTAHTAYPVFYDVEPSEVRKQSGAVAEAFSEHVKKESAGKWREAMKEAADLAGWELKKTADGHEAPFIQKIVKQLSQELRSFSFNIDEKLVGMDFRIKEVVSSLGTGHADVRMIGIKGIGGGGKTTLARAVFDHIFLEFEGKSFVENVREVSKASWSGLKTLQNQVLSDVLNDKDINISSFYDGKHMMKRMMRDKKVLLVLDDVDNIDQLEALAGELNWFKPGSRIIITTRDEQVLLAHRVKFIHDVTLLSNNEAICLFSRYAFGRDFPDQGYKELSRQVARYAAGLPLTIRVLGSFLCDKDELEWIDALDRLKTIPLAETLKKLELSFIGLEEDQQEIFLDVACILKGWPKDIAITALEICGFHARTGLRVLERKSLITIYHNSDSDECLGMHDHIEEMGKDIVRRSHPDKPYKHSRLWKPDEIEDIFANDLGTKAIRCIQFCTNKLNPHIVVKGLKKMKELRFLSVDFRGCFCNKGSNIDRVDFPNALRYMDLNQYPFSSLPKTFEANNLVALKMAHSRIVQLWEGKERKVLNKLRFLDLSCSMLSTFDLGLTPNLETLTLRRCTDLLELHMPIRCLKLLSLDLTCSSVRTLDLGLAPNLEAVILVECHNLVELHMPRRCLNLESLRLNNSKLRTLAVGLTPNLECLDLKNCYYLEELHMADECQKLSKLDISHSKLRILDLGLTPNLETLNLKECHNLVELRPSIGGLKTLVHLELSCVRFRSLLFEIKNYTCSVDESLEVGPVAELHLTAESLESCPLHPDNSLPKFQFDCVYKEDRPSLTRNIEMLFSVGMCACTNLETFSGSICGLRRLRKLKLEGSILEVPKDLCQLECLEELIISCCLLEKLPEDFGQLKCLEKLDLSYAEIKHLPDSISMLKRMKHLELNLCSLLETLPADIGQLEYLEKLHLSYAKIKHLPDSICMLKHLKHLELNFCSLLERLPEDLGQLECLEKLILVECGLLQDIPNSIGEMKCLTHFHLLYCIRVEKLPEELGSLECLEDLDIEGTSICHLPQTLLSKGLNIDWLKRPKEANLQRLDQSGSALRNLNLKLRTEVDLLQKLLKMTSEGPQSSLKSPITRGSQGKTSRYF